MLNLTPREREALELMARGLLIKEAAFKLGISIGAFKFHLHHAKRRLGARTLTQAVLICRDLAAAEARPTAIVHIDEDGDEQYHLSGGVELFVVDERSPHDRVYRMTVETPREEMHAILGEGPIGSRFDERHAAVAARINAAVDGRPHLTVIDNMEGEQ